MKHRRILTLFLALSLLLTLTALLCVPAAAFEVEELKATGYSTDLADLIAYLRSMQQMSSLADVPDETLLAAFRPRMADGVLSLPKEYGLFICR